MQAGRFSSGWPGLISPPSSAANLYLQSRGRPTLEFLAGRGSRPLQPHLVGGSLISRKKTPRWLLVVPLEEYRLHGVLETRYSPVAFQDWRWTYRHALGFDENGLLNQGEFSLQRSALDWRFIASLSGEELPF